MSVLALAERIAPLLDTELKLVINAGEAAESLLSKLHKLQSGLQKAEREGVTDTNVKDWLKQLESVAHEMEDVLDEWEILNCQMELEGVSHDPSNFLASLIINICSCFKPVLARHSISKKVKALSDRMDEILSERDRYNFVSGENSNRGHEFRQEPSTSIVPSYSIYGRECVMNSLVAKLVSSGLEKENVQIVSIVGIGGVGKTTLAQMAYNHHELQGLFDLRGWVSVSEPFDDFVVARAILEQFGQISAGEQLQTLVHRIKACVLNKRFLLVLDNVWTEDREKWENLMKALHHGANWSKILVTTRKGSVASMMGTALLEPLDPLSTSECSEILNRIALGGRGGRRRRRNEKQLRLIGVEIAKKCNGLPLIAKSLGSMLALKSSEEEWRAVLESPLWMHEEEGEREVNNSFRLLNLSYTELSPVLKRCFLSSAIFPRGAKMSIDEMIRIWMAHGYLNSKSSDLSDFEEVRSKGLSYFNILVNRSFFVKVDVDSFKMHDIMHEFATHILGNEGYSFIAHDGAPCDLPPASLGKLRTFCARDTYEENKLVQLKSVRVLSLCDCNLQLLPEGVGELVHLRYLDVSDNPIKELPKAVTNLYNLQTLGIAYCSELTSLPEGIEKLGRLRHILNIRTFDLKEYPQGLEKLSCLWTLSEFSGSNLGYLGNLNLLQGSLRLDLSDLNDVEQARKSNLGNKIHLKELEMIFERNERLDDTVLEALQPPPHLQILHIYGSKWLSHWTQRSFDDLKVVTIIGYYACFDPPPLGMLPSLEKLVIDRCGFKCLKTEFLGPQSSSERVGGFPRLKTLCFIRCREWEEWEDIKEEEASRRLCMMTHLEELELRYCGGLKALPHSLLRQATSLKTIKLYGRNASRLQGRDMTRLPNVNWVVRDTTPKSEADFVRKK